MMGHQGASSGLMGMGMNMNVDNDQMMAPPSRQIQEGCVLLVSNLEESCITPDKLFTLFGVYGDVTRVKILYNKKDTAFIQARILRRVHGVHDPDNSSKVSSSPVGGLQDEFIVKGLEWGPTGRVHSKGQNFQILY